MAENSTIPTERIIKKYQNRRLYDTEESAYITLQEVKDLVLQGISFTVQDANSGEDITRQVLLSIILEEEAGGVPLFSNLLLRQIISFYGHTFQGALGRFLEGNLRSFIDAQTQFQDQMRRLMPHHEDPAAMFSKMLGSQTMPNPLFGNYFENSKKMFEMMNEAFRNNPWVKNEASSPPAPAPKPATTATMTRSTSPAPKAKESKTKTRRY